MNATSPSSRRRGPTRLLVTASVMALPVAPALSGCSFGTTNFDAQTNEVYSFGEGVNDRSGSVEVLNALIVSDQPGTGRLIAGLVNKGDAADALTGVQGTDAGPSAGPSAGQTEAAQPLSVSNAGGSTDLPPGKLLQLADPGAATVLVSGDSVKAGGFVPVTLTFQHADPVTVDVPVVAPGEDFADVTIPSSSPTGSTSSSPTGSPTGTPSGTPSSSGSVSPSGSAS